MKRIAIFGGSFNPPGIHHRAIVEAAAQQFDEVIVVPCGPRPDKATTNFIDPVHRAVMCDMTFGDVENVTVDVSDLEREVFTRTHDLQARYEDRGEVWHIVGADQIEGGDEKVSFIHRRWMHAKKMWNTLRFAVFTRDGLTLNMRDLPPQHEVLDVRIAGASCIIRQDIMEGRTCEHLVVSRVYEYIRRYNLYLGTRPPYVTPFVCESPRPFIFYDVRNDQARPHVEAMVDAFGTHAIEEANIILVIGGDGTMLHAVREHWRCRLPFFGLNAGHRGYLLNAIAEDPLTIFRDELVIRHAPLLYAEVEYEDGSRCDSIAFNDAWVERASGQTAWIKIDIDGRVLLENLIADGALVATPAGSTAYARVMGAAPLHVGVEALVLAGSNVCAPTSWTHPIMGIDSIFRFSVVDPSKRPIRAFIDGVDHGIVRAMTVRISRIAAAELIFTRSQDISEKFDRMLRS